MEEIVEQLKAENILLREEVEQLKEKLKKYTAPERSKKYYENHKEEIKDKRADYNKEYSKSLSAEKKAEYNKKYYLKKKGLKEIETKD
jgi:hypothetical protein